MAPVTQPTAGNKERQMQTIKIINGTRQVIASRNDESSKWSSRVYVNGGETATLVTAKHSTDKGVRAWAAKQIGG